VRRAKELLYTGRWFSGTEAEVMGIANKAVPADELDAYVIATAKQISQVPLRLLALDKKATNKALDLMGAREGIEYSLTMHAISHTTEESHELDAAVSGGNWKEGLKERERRYQA